MRWRMRLQSGEATRLDHERLQTWLAEHPAHRQEYERLSTMWSVLKEVRPLLEVDHVCDRSASAAERPNRSTTVPVTAWGWRWVPVTAGAFMAVFVVASWWWSHRLEPVSYETAKGEQQQVTLPDGSHILLNTDTKLSVLLSDHMRSVSLDRGEAWFTVQHDEHRPFHVHVDNGRIHDLGTEFIVKKAPEQVQVSVMEGVVEVELRTDDPVPTGSRATVLQGGEQLWFDRVGRVSRIESIDLTLVGAWKGGQLIFQEQPLGQALLEVARYRSEEIRLLDPSLADIPVSGAFHIQHLETFVDALEVSLPIHTSRVSPHLVIVERAPAVSHSPQTQTR